MKTRCTFWSMFWVFVASAVATLVYLLYFEPPFLSYKGLPFQVEGPARPGESVKLIVTRCNSSDKPRDYELSHWLQNINTINTKETPTPLPAGKVPVIKPGCWTSRSAMNVVPAGTPPGIYRVGGAGQAEGTLRTVPVEWYSEWFEVLP